MERYPQAVGAFAGTYWYHQHKHGMEYWKTTPARDEHLLEYDGHLERYYHTSTFLLKAEPFRDEIREL